MPSPANRLLSFQVARLYYDVTVRFCDRYISIKSRTHDQMVQAARSGVQNIAEGSKAGGTSKKFELKLTNLARASLEELPLDYEDFLRHRSLPLWAESDPRRKALVARRCKTVEEVAAWVREVRRAGVEGPDSRGELGAPDSRGGLGGRDGLDGQKPDPSMESIKSMPSTAAGIAANATLVLLGVACALLDRQIEAQAAAFTDEGGFTERLHRMRTGRRKYGSK